MNNKENEISYSEICEAIVALLKMHAGILEPDTYSSVMHYLEHGEYEMAYEGLFIDLIAANFQPQNIDLENYLRIGIKLKLNKESVFKGDFWGYLKDYIKKR